MDSSFTYHLPPIYTESDRGMMEVTGNGSSKESLHRYLEYDSRNKRHHFFKNMLKVAIFFQSLRAKVQLHLNALAAEWCVSNTKQFSNVK